MTSFSHHRMTKGIFLYFRTVIFPLCFYICVFIHVQNLCFYFVLFKICNQYRNNDLCLGWIYNFAGKSAFFLREKLQDEFSKQIGSVFTQWEGDIQKSKDAEEKLEVWTHSWLNLNIHSILWYISVRLSKLQYFSDLSLFIVFVSFFTKSGWFWTSF